jgi:hypothetical protein
VFGDKEQHTVGLGKSRLRKLSAKLGFWIHAACPAPSGRVLFTRQGKIYQFKKGGLTTENPDG